MLRVSNFDFFHTESAMNSILNLDSDENSDEIRPFNAVFEQAGFVSTNFMLESSSTIFFVAGFLVFYPLILYFRNLLLKKCEKKDNCLMRQIRSRKFVLKAFLLRAFLESYLGLGISAFICAFNVHAWKFTSVSMSVAEFLAAIQILILLTGPLYLGLKSRRVFRRKEGFEKDLVLFKNLRVDKASAIVYNIIFMVRRFIAFSLIVHGERLSNFQVFFFLLCTFIVVVYLIMSKPFHFGTLNF